jgi:hypothetical protein
VRDLPLPLSDMMNKPWNVESRSQTISCSQVVLTDNRKNVGQVHFVAPISMIAICHNYMTTTPDAAAHTQDHFAIHIHTEPTQNIVYEHSILDTDV